MPYLLAWLSRIAEGAPKPDGAHVPRDVLALRIELAAVLTHHLSGLDERHLERLLHVRGVVTASTPEF